VDISLILPAYNESATICSTLAEAANYFRRRRMTYEIIVAADGEDGTRERAREFALSDPAVIVTGSSAREGKGKGIRQGVRMATGNIIGFADADNKVPVTEFDRIEPWLRDGYQVVIGSRALAASKIERRQPWYRRIGSWGFYYFMHLAVNIRDIEDTQCGFKFFPNEAAKDLFSRQRIDGYMFDIEILVLAQQLGYRVKEVPVRWRDDRDSRLALLSGNVRNVIDVLKIRSYCAAGKQTDPLVRSRATDA
jgi:dolichyl-phosphate beta-glucosyltransferase